MRITFDPKIHKASVCANTARVFSDAAPLGRKRTAGNRNGRPYMHSARGTLILGKVPYPKGANGTLLLRLRCLSVRLSQGSIS
ncbi:hypothetical protein EVAR_17097_1 [Eumeta japonica]|uniref:Uncharacterized protein n=1 Tax=Eumeta variegata TaxID=151549 RepID=A0A4C1V599_EUMVA|nr:hypothetical protein EVAR_17097_1 [Eumeta japonica]